MLKGLGGHVVLSQNDVDPIPFYFTLASASTMDNFDELEVARAEITFDYSELLPRGTSSSSNPTTLSMAGFDTYGVRQLCFALLYVRDD